MKLSSVLSVRVLTDWGRVSKDDPRSCHPLGRRSETPRSLDPFLAARRFGRVGVPSLRVELKRLRSAFTLHLPLSEYVLR